MSTPSHAMEQELSSPAENQPSGQAQATAWTGTHPVNIRLSIPFFGARYYLTLVAGKEKRSPERLREEKRKHPLATRANIAVLAVLGTLTGLALWAGFQILSVLVLQDLGMVVGAS